MPAKKGGKKGGKKAEGEDGGEQASSEVKSWLEDPKVVLGSRFEDFEKMGIRVVADFAEMDSEDIDALFPDSEQDQVGKTKFDRKRFEKALKQSVPTFLMGGGPGAAAAEPAVAESKDEAPPAAEDADAAEDPDAALDGGDDALTAQLAQYMLGDICDKLRAIGIALPSDLLEMDEDDIRGLRLDKFSRKRFDKMFVEMQASATPATAPPRGAAAPPVLAGPSSADSRAATFGGATRAGPTPEMSMRFGTRQALDACATALPSSAPTVSSFYDHWQSTTHTVAKANRRQAQANARRGAEGYVPSANQLGEMDADAAAAVDDEPPAEDKE
eukprot:g6817.t1